MFKKVLIPVIRLLGIIEGIYFVLFAVILNIFPSNEPVTNESKLDNFFFITLPYLLIALCLLIPYKLIKNPKHAFVFFSLFLILSVGFISTAIISQNEPIHIIFYILLVANVVVNYKHYRKLLRLESRS